MNQRARVVKASREARALPFPDLPDLPAGESGRCAFWRAAYLRDIAMLAAVKAFAQRSTFDDLSEPLKTALFLAENSRALELKASRATFVRCGGDLDEVQDPFREKPAMFANPGVMPADLAGGAHA
jgi:hypothetical protein